MELFLWVIETDQDGRENQNDGQLTPLPKIEAANVVQIRGVKRIKRIRICPYPHPYPHTQNRIQIRIRICKFQYKKIRIRIRPDILRIRIISVFAFTNITKNQIYILRLIKKIYFEPFNRKCIPSQKLITYFNRSLGIQANYFRTKY